VARQPQYIDVSLIRLPGAAALIPILLVTAVILAGLGIGFQAGEATAESGGAAVSGPSDPMLDRVEAAAAQAVLRQRDGVDARPLGLPSPSSAAEPPSRQRSPDRGLPDRPQRIPDIDPDAPLVRLEGTQTITAALYGADRLMLPPDGPHPPPLPDHWGEALGASAAAAIGAVAPVPDFSAPPAHGDARLVIIIDDMGVARGGSDAVVALPGPLTLSFLPYADNLAAQARAAQAVGHGLMLHLPMQPESDTIDPGPGALRVDMDDDELRRRTRTALASFSGFHVVNNHMGSRMTADARAMRPVLEEIDAAGHVFLDSQTTPSSQVPAVAAILGIDTLSRDFFLDHIRAEADIEAAFNRSVRLARDTGLAIAIGHPYPETRAVLSRRLPQLQAAGVRLVTIDSLLTREEASASIQ